LTGPHPQDHRPERSLAARALAIDIVIEGSTAQNDDRGLLEQIAAAHDRKVWLPQLASRRGDSQAALAAVGKRCR
jgi:hypothetical protein